MVRSTPRPLPSSMLSLWLEDRKLSLREIPLPEVTEGEVLVRLRLAGICGTDLALLNGYVPFTGVPGHEFVGEVVWSPEKSDWIGRRVVGEINASCDWCEHCLAGRSSHCESRTVLGISGRAGVFSEYFALPVSRLHAVAERVADEAAVFTEPLAAACQVLQQVSIGPGDRVLLIGAGRLGQLIAQVMNLAGCNLLVVARHSLQKQLLARREIPVISENEMPERKVDLVIEATGSREGFFLARKAVRPRGTIVLKSTYPGRSEVDLSSLVVDEVTLIGSRCGPFVPALRLLEQGLVTTDGLIEDRYPLSKGIAAFEQAARPGTMKVLIEGQD